MGRVALDAPLEDGDDFVGELVGAAWSVVNRSRLQTVEFVERPVDRSVCYEMVDIIVFRGELLCLVNEGGGAGEGVVDVADEF